MTNERAIPPACDSEYVWSDSEQFLGCIFGWMVRDKKHPHAPERAELAKAFDAGRKQLTPTAWAKSKIYEWHDDYSYLVGNFANRPLSGEAAIRNAFNAGRALKGQK